MQVFSYAISLYDRMDKDKKTKADIEFSWLIIKSLSLIALVGFCMVLYFNNPKNWDYAVCPSMYMRHVKCPFCGNLIAFHHLFNGDIAEALAKNAVGMAVTILLVAMFYIPALGKNLYLRTLVIMAIGTWAVARIFVKYEFFNDLLDMFGL